MIRIWHNSTLIYVANLELRTVKVPQGYPPSSQFFSGALHPWSSSTWTGGWMEDGNVFISSLGTTNKLWCARSYCSNNTVHYPGKKTRLSKVVGSKYEGDSHNHSRRLCIHIMLSRYTREQLTHQVCKQTSTYVNLASSWLPNFALVGCRLPSEFLSSFTLFVKLPDWLDWHA